MEALTQCWFTRVHQPERKRHREPDGSVSSLCRHCHRPIVSWNRLNWFLAGGFNVTRLAETAARFITVLDREDDYIVARYPVAHLPDEAAIDAFKLQLREQHGMNEPGSSLVLVDSGRKKRGRMASPPAGVSGAEPDSPQSA